jgi:hypothetical protein
VYAIVGEANGRRCLPFAVSETRPDRGALRARQTFKGDKWVPWWRTLTVQLGYRRTQNKLQLYWLGTSSTENTAPCGFSRRQAPPVYISTNPPACGAERIATRCDARSIQLNRGTLYLDAEACQKALDGGAPSLSLGDCDKKVGPALAGADEPPAVDESVLNATKRLNAIAAKKQSIYWLEPDEKRWCERWKVTPTKPNRFRMERKYRKGRMRVTDSHDMSVKGIVLHKGGLGRQELDARGRGGSFAGNAGRDCLPVTGGDKHHIAFIRDVALFTNRRACRKAARAARKKTRPGKKEPRPARKRTRPARK